MESGKFKKGDKLYFKSEFVKRKHRVIFKNYCEDGINCVVVFSSLNGISNNSAIVHYKFLSK